jgi:hypothetical protein
MNPESLITEKIIEYCKTQPIIMILGKTKSGKVTIARKLSMDTGHELFIADEFIDKYGYDNALEQFELELNNCYYSGKKVIFEGILCYRLLRRLIGKGFYLPNMLIKVDCNEQTISHFYSLESPEKNLTRVFGFNSGLDKIFEESLLLLESQNKKLPILTLNTSIF